MSIHGKHYAICLANLGLGCRCFEPYRPFKRPQDPATAPSLHSAACLALGPGACNCLDFVRVCHLCEKPRDSTHTLPSKYPGKLLCSSCAGVTRSGAAVALVAELNRARAKFPGNAKLLVALMEEVGELAKALLQRRPLEEIRAEAIQVACVAIRIFEEGDADFANVTDEQAQP